METLASIFLVRLFPTYRIIIYKVRNDTWKPIFEIIIIVCCYNTDEYDGLDWHTRYAIIKGICMGLKYLHEELKPPIYHLDLKPANVLLDEKMVPKIADFGLSRLFGEEQTLITKSFMGTQ
jgi:serine/threonine protein kinase